MASRGMEVEADILEAIRQMEQQEQAQRVQHALQPSSSPDGQEEELLRREEISRRIRMASNQQQQQEQQQQDIQQDMEQHEVVVPPRLQHRQHQREQQHQQQQQQEAQQQQQHNAFALGAMLTATTTSEQQKTIDHVLAAMFAANPDRGASAQVRYAGWKAAQAVSSVKTLLEAKRNAKRDAKALCRAHTIKTIADFIKANPNASQETLKKEVEREIRSFADRVKAI